MEYSDVQHGNIMIFLNGFHEVLNSLHCGIIVVDNKGVISFFNHATTEGFLKLGEEAIGKSINEVFVDFKTKEILDNAQPQYDIKLKVFGRFISINCIPIIYKGEVVGAFLINNEITDSENTFNQMFSVRELNDLIDSSVDGLAIIDGEGTMIGVNKAYRMIVGIPLDENLTGQPVIELVNKGYLSDLVTLKVINTGCSATMLQKIRNKEILFTGTPVKNELGEVVRVIANIRDLTELNSLRRNIQLVSEKIEHYQSELVRLKNKELLEGFIFNSPEMQKVLELAIRVAGVDATVLITGESGVGKEIIAQIIREASKRSSGPFIKVNCGALAPSIVESQLFGYDEGSFTGAIKKGKPGIFEMASNGTLFLDEVGELSLDLQVKLLRAIQDKVITRLGGTKSIPVNIRLITATNRNLSQMVEEGKFRKDLYFRLNVVNICIPPLREHKTDIPFLVQHFLNRFCQKYNFERKVSPELLHAFSVYEWPGNIRELENTIERMVILSPTEWLDTSFFNGGKKNSVPDSRPLSTLKEALEETEKKMILQAYQLTGTTRKAASLLGIDQSTVARKLKIYQIKKSYDVEVQQ